MCTWWKWTNLRWAEDFKMWNKQTDAHMTAVIYSPRSKHIKPVCSMGNLHTHTSTEEVRSQHAWGNPRVKGTQATKQHLFSVTNSTIYSVKWAAKPAALKPKHVTHRHTLPSVAEIRTLSQDVYTGNLPVSHVKLLPGELEFISHTNIVVTHSVRRGFQWEQGGKQDISWPV